MPVTHGVLFLRRSAPSAKGCVSLREHAIPMHGDNFIRPSRSYERGLCGSAAQSGFDAMSRLKQVEIMLGSDSPKLLNPHVYRYLVLLFNSRQHQLRIPTVQGKGRGLVGSPDPAFILETASARFFRGVRPGPGGQRRNSREGSSFSPVSSAEILAVFLGEQRLP